MSEMSSYNHQWMVSNATLDTALLMLTLLGVSASALWIWLARFRKILFVGFLGLLLMFTIALERLA